MSRRIAAAICLAVVCSASFVLADTIFLRDGSTLKGTVTSLVNDTLRVDTSFGQVKVPVKTVSSIVFGDGTTPPVLPGTSATEPSTGGDGVGVLSVTFKNDELSSKITVRKQKDLAGHLRANWITQSLVVDGTERFTYVDSTTDKTIYKGEDRIYRNDIELQPMDVELGAGAHEILLVVQNQGAEHYRDRFDGDPIEMEIPIDVVIGKDVTSRIQIGISRGKLRMGKPRFYRVN